MENPDNSQLDEAPYKHHGKPELPFLAFKAKTATPEAEAVHVGELLQIGGICVERARNGHTFTALLCLPYESEKVARTIRSVMEQKGFERYRPSNE